MNWFVKWSVDEKSIDPRADLCPHVEEDVSKAFICHQETDSFGPVGQYVACKECNEELRKEEEEEKHHCRDCGNTVLMKNGRFWKWYDFYAPQGDEALFVCDECWTEPQHENRMERDNEEYHEEMRRFRR